MKIEAFNQTVLLNQSDARFAEPLADAGFDVQHVSWHDEIDIRPSVVVSDRALPIELRKKFESDLASGLIGHLSIGHDATADVSISESTSLNEVVTAVRLLAEIVRLRKQALDEAEHIKTLTGLAFTDPLTGLPNRRAWEAHLEQLRAAEQSLCVAFIDLDFFKQINDEKGHSCGDQVLVRCAQTMRARLRKRDFLARIGGDEFGLAATGVDESTAKAVVERVCNSVADLSGNVELPTVTMSAGFVYLREGEAATAQSILAAASDSLRQAKLNNRDCNVGVLSVRLND